MWSQEPHHVRQTFPNVFGFLKDIYGNDEIITYCLKFLIEGVLAQV
jgi:hypothetical protein